MALERPVRVAIVAPSPAVRAGLGALLNTAAALAGMAAVVCEAATPDTLNLPPETDVLVVTSENGLPPALAAITAGAGGQLALLVLSDEPLDAAALAELPVRAWGLLPLDASADELGAAVWAVNEGLLVGVPSLLKPSFTRRPAALALNDQPLERLSEREAEVLQLLALGLANKQIGARLGISEHTVKFHVSAIYAKLGVTNRAEAVRRGVQQGIILL